MADQILDQIRDVVEGQIVSIARSPPSGFIKAANRPQDFEGQKLAELIVNVGLSLVGVSTAIFTIATGNC